MMKKLFLKTKDSILETYTDYYDLARESHLYFHRHIHPININSQGDFLPGHAKEGHDNDIDAFRHAYVSAAYATHYPERIADMAGQLNELVGNITGQDLLAANQDLWNNAHGRRYAEDFLDRDIEPSSQDLLQAVEKGLRNGELIIDPFTDLRRYDSSTEDDRYIRTRDRANHHSELHDNSSALGGTGTDPLTDSTLPDTQSLIRTTVEEFGMFTREQQQNFMMELNGWGIQFDVPTINAYLRDHLLQQQFPELPEDGRAHIVAQATQYEAEEGEKFSTRELTEYAQYELNRHLIRETFPEMPADGVQHIIDQVRQTEREDGTVFPREDMFAYAAYELEKHQQSLVEREAYIEGERAELASLYQQRDDSARREALEREYLEAQMEVRALQQQQEIQRYQDEIAEVQWQQQQVQQREDALERMRNLEVEIAQIRQEEVGYLTTEYEKTQAQVERLENREEAYSGGGYWQEMVSNDNSGGRMDEGKSWAERETAREESREASGGFGIGYGSSGPSYDGDGCYGGGPGGDGGGYGGGGDGSGGGGDS